MYRVRRRLRSIRPTSFGFLIVVLIVLYWIGFPSLRSVNGVQDKDRYFVRRTEATFDSRKSPRTVKKQILLVTYGRSGSTFTSALIKQQEGVFFVYEPLYALNTSVSRPNNEKGSMAIVKAFLNCDFTAQYAFVLLNRNHINNSTASKWFRCMQSSVNDTAMFCFLKMQAECRSKQVTLIKTIRFQVKWAESLLAGNPHFKLLFLVRDPRPTLFSQARVFGNFNKNTQMYTTAQQHCSRLALDLQDAERLHKLYPGQVKGIRYEHGATDTLSYAKDIYNFLGLSFDNALVSYIKNITAAHLDNPKVNRTYGVFRHNSTQTMNNWRFKASFNSVQEVDKACAHLYSKLGYQTVLSQTQLQSQKSLVLLPDPGGIF
ncbi:hypothetical protein BsWGS_09037 [Bradybaena similaris]